MKPGNHSKSKQPAAAKPKSADANGQLATIAGRLGGHLRELEKEYLRLDAELKKKKAARARLDEKRAANPGSSDEVARRRAARLRRNIDKSGAYVRKQSAFLQKVKAFHERNERMLEMIAERLVGLEQELQSPDGPTPEARAHFQNELLGMLAELQAMRKKREKLVQASAES
jgi:hypothetical protein